jgi:hypothetical protein
MLNLFKSDLLSRSDFFIEVENVKSDHEKVYAGPPNFVHRIQLK